MISYLSLDINDKYCSYMVDRLQHYALLYYVI